MTQGSVVHVRRTIVVEYDVERDDYEGWSGAEIVAYETKPARNLDGWSILDYDNDMVTGSHAEVTFR